MNLDDAEMVEFVDNECEEKKPHILSACKEC